MHPPGNRIPTELRDAILRYLRERRAHSLISTSDAVEVVGREFPATSILTRRDLTEAIAQAAIDAGFNISFDGDETGV